MTGAARPRTLQPGASRPDAKRPDANPWPGAVNRRDWLRSASLPALQAYLGASGLASLAGCAGTTPPPTSAHVLVVGGGYGGCAAARHIRLLSGGRIKVTLVEPAASFVSGPMSNLVLGGHAAMADITRPYDSLVRRHGVQLVRDRVAAIDPQRKTATLGSGATLAWDRLVLSPGVDMIWSAIEDLAEVQAAGRVLQAWQAGAETAALRRQLLAMPDGGVFAICIPELPYRCPPAPYERACQVASYFKAAKPRSKVLVLDANPDLTAQGTLFRKAWAALYPGMVEYRAQHKAIGVDLDSNTARFELQDDVQADVLNLLPPMRAGQLAVQTGLANANARWCLVDFLSFESTAARHVHVLGDAVQGPSGMPKSGHIARDQAKVAAAAIVADLAGWQRNAQPRIGNSCFSFVDGRSAGRLTSVHDYVAAEKTFKTVVGAGSASAAPSQQEGDNAWAWARDIWADLLG